MMGLEPTTLGTTNRCSNQLSYIYRFGECKCKNLRPKCKAFFNITLGLPLYPLGISKFVFYDRAIGRVKRNGDAL
jgi:hypothetical protein